jgi:methanogenic corrinoid protein MtbC1
MVASILADAGYRDVNLGPDVPSRTVAEAVARYRPRIVWLAVSTPLAAETLRRECAAIAGALDSSGATLIVGGRGADAAAIAALPRVHLLATMAEMGAFARGLRAA